MRLIIFMCVAWFVFECLITGQIKTEYEAYYFDCLEYYSWMSSNECKTWAEELTLGW